MSTAIACFREGGELRLPSDLPSLPTRQAALIELSRPVAPIHDRRQELPPELVTQALANATFEDYPGVETKAGAPPEARGAANPAVRYFCDLGRTDPFAHLFQLYNSRLRSFAEFAALHLMRLRLISVRWSQ